MRKILLTGATGFIGSHVLEALTAAGESVVVLARERSNLDHVRSVGAEVIPGDLLYLGSLSRAIRGCDAVVHTAALANDWASWNEFYATNVQGTLNVLRAATQQGIRQVLITGSVSSYGEEDCITVKDETSPDKSHHPYFLEKAFPSRLNYYRDSKAIATREAARFAQDNQLLLTILEPVWVYGEREFGTGFYDYLRAARKGTLWMPGSRTNLFHVIYARDLARAYVLALHKRLPGVERIIIGNPAPAPLHRIFEVFCQEAGVPMPGALPEWLTYPVGFLLETAATVLKASRPPLLTRGRVKMFYDSISYSVAKAKRLLDFEAEVPLEAGIRATVAWYKANQLI
jgi:nucleoside-diphosphate-sugar epimerase